MDAGVAAYGDGVRQTRMSLLTAETQNLSLPVATKRTTKHQCSRLLGSHGRDECRPLFFSFEQGEDDISHYTHLLQQVLAVTLKGSGQTAIAELFKSHDRVHVERQMSSQSLSQQWQCDHATTFTQRTHHPAFRRVPPLLVRGVKWNVMQVQGRLGG